MRGAGCCNAPLGPRVLLRFIADPTMKSSLLPPKALRFNIETHASVAALQAVFAEIRSDGVRAAEIRHVKIDWRVHVLSTDAQVLLEMDGIPRSAYVRAVAEVVPGEGGTALVGRIFRPGADAVRAVLAGCALFLVWKAIGGLPIALVPLPLLAWIEIVATRIAGSNRRRAAILLETLRHIARLAEQSQLASADSTHPGSRTTPPDVRSQSFLARTGLGSVIAGALSCGWLTFQTFRLFRPHDLEDGLARIELGLLFGALVGWAWFASRDWNFLGRWTPVARGVVAGEASAWLIADVGMSVGGLQHGQILMAGAAAGLLLGLWAESSEGLAE